MSCVFEEGREVCKVCSGDMEDFIVGLYDSLNELWLWLFIKREFGFKF